MATRKKAQQCPPKRASAQHAVQRTVQSARSETQSNVGGGWVALFQTWTRAAQRLEVPPQIVEWRLRRSLTECRQPSQQGTPSDGCSRNSLNHPTSNGARVLQAAPVTDALDRNTVGPSLERLGNHVGRVVLSGDKERGVLAKVPVLAAAPALEKDRPVRLAEAKQDRFPADQTLAHDVADLAGLGLGAAGTSLAAAPRCRDGALVFLDLSVKPRYGLTGCVRVAIMPRKEP